MAIRIFKLELKNPETKERVDFGPRKMGETGRDILIVKRALGAVVDYSSLVDPADGNPSLEDPEGWFDCTTGVKLSKMEAATFDSNMQKYLIKFQLDNQFHILNYLFAKFSVNKSFEELQKIEKNVFSSFPDYQEREIRLPSGGVISVVPGILPSDELTSYLNSKYTSTITDLMFRLFDLELGTLGEATLAVMHGWRPRSVYGETSYHHNPRVFSEGSVAYDLVLLGLYAAFVQGKLTQKLEDTPDIIEPRADFVDYIGTKEKGLEFLRKYEDQVSSAERLRFNAEGPPDEYIIRSSYFGGLKYRVITRDERSVLYDSMISVTTEQPIESSSSSEAVYDSIRRAFEPDPLTDPPPFDIDALRIGFFHETEYTLSNLPPKFEEGGSPTSFLEYQTEIRALEDRALDAVLKFYNKPDVWILDPESEGFKELYEPHEDVFPNHDATFAPQTKYVLSTATSIERYTLLDGAQKYDIVEKEFDDDPLIKFVEFRSPSLRPGDVYRAKFEVNRKKLNLIQEGTNLREQQDLPVASEQPRPVPNLSVSCDGDPINEEEQQRRYEEYRALANKRKREIARILRENALENYNNTQSIDQTSADLGVFGNANLNLSSNQEGYRYTTETLSNLVDTLSAGRRQDISQVSNPKFSDLTELRINFGDLETGLKKAADNLRSAQENCDKDNVLITPSDFNGNTEANRLGQIVPQLRKYIKSRFDDFEFGTDEEGRARLQGFFDRSSDAEVERFSTSNMRFRFEPSKNNKGLQVTSFSASGAPVKNMSNFLKEVPILKNPRTVAYLAQVEEMSETPGFLGIGSSCEDIGFGKKGLAYIVKHTMTVSGFSQGEYNPIEVWTKNNVTDPIENWRNIKEIIDFEGQMKVDYGTDQILSVFGDQCISIKQFYEEFKNRFSITGLICDYIKCIRLPSFDLQLPKLSAPPRPDFSIFGWYAQLIDTLIEKWNEFLAQILCAFAKALIDILKVSCPDQLQDELYGSASGSTPTIKRALVDGLSDLNLSPDNIEKSKQLIDEMALFLTGEELCRILQGGDVDAATMNMILRLADRIGIEETDTEDTLRSFFETISIFLPSTFCENLSQSTSVIGSATCAETSSLLDQIRRRMLTNDATDEEIQQAVDIANKNLMSQTEALQRLGEEGLNAIIPSTMDFSDPNSLLTSLPDTLASQINKTVENLFEPAKMGYASSLSNFGPALFLNSSRLANPEDPEYNQESNIIVKTILENLKLYAALGSGGDQDPTSLRQQLAVLYQIYELEEVQTPNGPRKIVKIYADNDGSGEKVPQEKVGLDAFPYVGYEVARSSTRPLFLKPVGFAQDNFFAVNNAGRIMLKPEDPEAIPKDRLGLEIPEWPLSNFTFITAYKLIKHAAEREEDPLDIEVSSFLRERINDRLQQLQGLLQVHLENVSKMVTEDSYLKVLKDVLKLTFETARENQTDPSLSSVEIVDVEQITPSRQAIDLKFSVPALGALRPAVTLNEFTSTGQTNRFDPYTIEVKGSPLFTQDQVFEYCDTVPGPGLNEQTLTADQARDRDIFEEAIRGIPPGIYTRRELFARKIWDSVKRKVDFIYDNRPGEQQRAETDQETRQRSALSNYQNNFLRNHVYNSEAPNFFEGVFEQVLFSLRQSRIFDEEGYYPDLKRRVNGEVYFSEEEGCYKNRYNVSQLGMLSFEKIVTDDIAQQIAIEMSKPENNLYNLDVDDPSPIDKAIQNVCFIGFIRICILELVLKGSIAYPVWDVEGVADEPFMRDFFIRFVEEELKRHSSLSDKWEKVAERVTGIEQPKAALKDIIQKQLTKVQGLSKKIFKNDPDVDYYNWFVKYFVPQTEVSRAMAIDMAGDTGTIRVGDRDDIPDKIFWQHPLRGTTSRALSLGPRQQLEYQPQPIDLLAGNDPFFHIEHCLEVMGPLADLENLVLPTNEIVGEIFNSEPGSPRSTDLGPDFARRRDQRSLSISSAYERTNMPEIRIEEYNVSSRIELPFKARGSAAEPEDGLNTLHEIFHIDDFIDGLNTALNFDDLEKIILHHRGLMHYDDDPAGAPGGLERNTSEPSANARPEVIRRTPTRFITTKRRVFKFEQDFISHEKESLMPDNRFSLIGYVEQLYGNPIVYTGATNETALESFESLRNKVSQVGEEESRHYIVPTNGEELLALREAGVTIREAPNDGRFTRYMIQENGPTVDESNRAAGMGVFFSQQIKNEQGIDEPKDTYIQAFQSGAEPRGRGLKKNKELQASFDNLSDTLTHRRLEDGQESEVIFENRLGLVDEQEFEQIKERYEAVHEETWVETVFEFSDSASIIAGLFGSFTIGETFDPAVLRGVSDNVVSRALREDLQDAMDRLYADGGNQLNGAAVIEKAKITGMKDERLSQYGRVLYTKNSEDPNRPEVHLARFMGINPKTNTAMTHHWLTDPRALITGGSMFEYQGNETIPADDRVEGDAKTVKQRESRKHVLSHSGFAAGTVPSANEVFPPNFYKIPIRILVTQVYISDAIPRLRGRTSFPDEVYCKVVPPEYIRNLHDDEALQDNIDNLNAALAQIMTEYRVFVERFLETTGVDVRDPGRRNRVIDEARGFNPRFPDFSTDFTRDHRAEQNNSNIQEDTQIQYCSIERIYSKIFENEVHSDRYNSTEELDELFRHRGSLLSSEQPRAQLGNAIPNRVLSRQLREGNSPRRTYIEDVPLDHVRALQSYNLFYRVNNEESILSNQSSFHKTVFSLKNIFNWYLKNRRDNTLWGALTPPFGLTKPGRQQKEAVDGDTQRLPLAMSYSDKLRTPGAHGHVVPDPDAPRRHGRSEYDVTEDFPFLAEWAIGILPEKRYDLYRIITADSVNDINGINLDADKREIWQQPGLVTLYPGAEDVNNIESFIADGERGLWMAEINKSDLSNWNFYSSDAGPGLISDGLGTQLINYNRYEHTPFHNVGSSPFLADGMFSFADFKTFMKTLISRLLIDSGLRNPRSRINPSLDIYNFESFYNANAQRNSKLILDLLTTRNPRLGEFNFDEVEVYSRDPGRRLRISRPQVTRLVDALLAIILNLYNKSARQAAFKKISEASAAANMEILHAPYKFRLLYRLIKRIKTEGHPPEHALMLLAVFSSYNFETNVLYAAAEQRRRVGNLNDDQDRRIIQTHRRRYAANANAESSPLLDWAVACLHFMAVAHRREAKSFVLDFEDNNRNPGLIDEYNALIGIFTRPGNDGLYWYDRDRMAVHENAADVGFFAGNDHANQSADVLWRRMRQRVLDYLQGRAVHNDAPVDNHGLTLTNLIRFTNRLFPIISDVYRFLPEAERDNVIRPNIGVGDRAGVEFNTFRNNRFIFEALMSTSVMPDLGVFRNQAFTPPDFREKYMHLYQRAWNQYNEYVADVSIEPGGLYSELQEREYVRNLLSREQAADIKEGNISKFIAKLDYSQFKDMFTRLDERSGFRVFRRDVKYISDLIIERAGNISEGENMPEYYKRIMPMMAHRRSLYDFANNTFSWSIKAVDELTDRWNSAFEEYTGITSGLMGQNLLSNAVFGTEVLGDLIDQSEINQISRLVANAPVKDPAASGANQGVTRNYNTFVTRDDGVIQQVSEEYRSFHMFGAGNRSIFSVPVAEAKKQISGPNVGVIDCFDLATFRQDYINLQPWLTDQLIESPDARQIFQYIFPIKRYQAVSTAFVTSCLAGYSRMPTILQTPKASLAALMSIVATNRRDRAQLLEDFSQGEFMKQIMDNPTSSHKDLDCFGFPYPADFIKQFVDLLTELFTTFPSVFFRGIASVADPAYKEMKLHWENCDIDKLTFSGMQLAPTWTESDMTAGLMGTPDGQRDSKYAMILPSYYIDIYTITAILAANPLSTGSWIKFGRVIERLAGYILKGGVSLLDQGFSFQSSCNEDRVDWPGQEGTNPWNFDRYGHPMSPLTVFALMFPELKGELRQRERAGCPNDDESPYSRDEIEASACANDDPEESPFGPISDLGEE